MVVGVCVVVVRLVVEYSECAATLRLAALQLLTRLTDVLRRFNTDTCRYYVYADILRVTSYFQEKEIGKPWTEKTGTPDQLHTCLIIFVVMLRHEWFRGCREAMEQNIRILRLSEEPNRAQNI